MSKKNYFEELMGRSEEQIRLAEAALQIAGDEYPDMDLTSYLKLLESWGEELRKKSSSVAASEKVDRINELLFGRMNFSGNADNYYDPKNSFLNDVIETRKGIPITLSVIYLEVAWRLDLDAAGVGFPGHFLVRIMADGHPLFVDPFHKGKIMSAGGCVSFWKELTDGEVEFHEDFLSVISKKQILSRMLRNLKGIYLEQKNYRKLLPVMDKLITLNPDLPEEVRDRGIIHYERQAFRLALRDFESFLSVAPDSEDADVIQQYVEILRDYSSHMN